MKPITVGEAIELLQQYPPASLFLTSGYENGYDVPEFKHIEVLDMTGKMCWWEGDFIPCKDGQKAVIVSRPSGESKRSRT